MRVLPRWFWLGCLCLGCQSLNAVSFSPRAREAREHWEEGQAAMKRGEVDEAVSCYEQSLAADPKEGRPHLSLAAAFLEKGEDEAAQTHLAEYVHAHPQDLGMRLRHAELLLRMKHLCEARTELEHVVADALNLAEPPTHPLIHCQTRLMEIAEAEGDEYGIHLHRGIGVYFIACQRGRMEDATGQSSTEALLCQAAGELALAHLERPEEARPCWYLYEVWTHLDQRMPALHHLREADAAAPFSYLTPAEKNRLYLARERLPREIAIRR
jgi:tetratricopeptide (TPR) repeat protein